jgi:hypothetical protein
MTLRRTFVGLAVVLALSVWAWARPAETPAPAQTAEPPLAAQPTAEGGNYDEAVHHYRDGRSRHWRQVMVGTGH